MAWKQFARKIWLQIAAMALKKAFNYVDKDKDGKWSKEEIETAVKEIQSLLTKLKKQIKK